MVRVLYRSSLDAPNPGTKARAREVSKLTREGLRQALAVLEGDPELADAVYHIATERGVRRVADAYLEKRPQAKRRWEEFVAAQTEASELRGMGRILERGLTEHALSSS